MIKRSFLSNLAKTSAINLQFRILWVKLDQKAFMTNEEWLGGDWILDVLKIFGGLSADGRGPLRNIKILPKSHQNLKKVHKLWSYSPNLLVGGTETIKLNVNFCVDFGWFLIWLLVTFPEIRCCVQVRTHILYTV